jgi:FOG: FHA domain
MDPARAATTHPPSASSRADARTTPKTRDFSKRRRAHDDDDDDGARATLVTALVAACACACAAWIKRAFDARRRATRDDRGTEKTMKDFPTAKGADGADDPVKKRLSFSGMSASSLASGGEEEEEKKPSRAMATRAERIEEETTTANGAETNGTKSPSAPSTPTREASREKRERQASLSPSRRPAMKLEVLGGASQGATFVASLGVDEFTVGRGRVNRFVVESVEVSTVHAKFRWDGAVWTMRDLGSLNGTRVNGSTISGGNRAPGPWQKITHGDVIKLGERDSRTGVSVSFFRDVSAMARLP